MNTQIKFTTAAEAVKVIKSGDHIHLSSVASAPQCLIKAMCERGANHEFKDVHIHHLHTEGPAPYADPQFEGIFQLDSFFVGGKDFKGKKVALISCCQESDMTVFDGAVKPIERGAKLCKWDMVGNVLVPGVDAVGDIAKTDGCAQAAALADKF